MKKSAAVQMRWIAMIALTAVFVVSLGGLLMSQDEHGHAMIVPCPLMQDQLTMCPMSVAEHLEKWQELLTAPISTKDILLVLTSVILLAFVIRLDPALTTPPRKRSLLLQNAISSLFDHLCVALSRGKIQPLFYGREA